MADKQQRAVKRLHRLLDPLPGVDVQMVGGLIEDEEIDLLVHQHAKPQPCQLTAGQHADALEYLLAPELIGRQAVAGALRRHVLLFIEHGVHQRALGVGKMNGLLQVCRADGRA